MKFLNRLPLINRIVAGWPVEDFSLRYDAGYARGVEDAKKSYGDRELNVTIYGDPYILSNGVLYDMKEAEAFLELM